MYGSHVEITTRRSDKIGRAQTSCAEGEEFECQSRQINDFENVYVCRYLSRCSALLDMGNDWLVQCQDNVTE